MRLSTLESDFWRSTNIKRMVATERLVPQGQFDPRELVDDQRWSELMGWTLNPPTLGALQSVNYALALLFPERSKRLESTFEMGISYYEPDIDNGRYESLLFENDEFMEFLCAARPFSLRAIDRLESGHPRLLSTALERIKEGGNITNMEAIRLTERLLLSFPQQEQVIRANMPNHLFGILRNDLETYQFYFVQYEDKKLTVSNFLEWVTAFRLFIPKEFAAFKLSPEIWQVMKELIEEQYGKDNGKYGTLLGQVAVAAAEEASVGLRGLSLKFAEASPPAFTPTAPSLPPRKEV